MRINAHDMRDVWNADEIQRIIDRNAPWAMERIVTIVRSLMRSGRPIFTEKISQQEQLDALLLAPPQFWDAMQTADPEQAAALVAQVLRAREKGKIPPTGPRAAEVLPEDGLDTSNIGDEGTGTERAMPLAPSIVNSISPEALV